MLLTVGRNQVWLEECLLVTGKKAIDYHSFRFFISNCLELQFLENFVRTEQMHQYDITEVSGL